jgi:hypothetical protein
MNVRVLFLDIDGVLNYERYVRRSGQVGVVIDPARMELLKRIIDATGALIVLTTSWREHWSPKKEDCDEMGRLLNELFASYNIFIFDKTPHLHSRREQEIGAWLEDHPEVTAFAVLDDQYLSADFLSGHFVKTANYRYGLDEENVTDTIAILTQEGKERLP